MTIAHVVDSMEVGGAETLVVLLCRLHRTAGHSSTVHCLFRGGPLARQLEGEGFHVRIHGPLQNWRLSRSLYREFRSSPPDLVHCHNATATIWAAPAARYAGAGAIISTRHGLVRPPYALRRELAFWLAARCCNRVVAVCSAAHNNLAVGCGAVAGKIITLRNGAAAASSGPPPVQPVRKDGFTLVNVARLAWYKDHATLLRAVNIAGQVVPDLRLWIAGDGAEAGPLHALAGKLGLEGRVCFLGEREDVGRWLAAADLFVLSSLTEGLPVSLLEAMAVGLPAIVTNVGGMPEVARLSGAATVVPPGRPDLLAQAIEDHAAHRGEQAARGALARRCYERYFTPQRMADDYLRLYQECLQDRGRATAADRELARGAGGH